MGSGQGVFAYDAGQEAWWDISTGIADVPIADLSAGSDDRVFAATANGVFYLNPGKELWNPVNAGLTDVRAVAVMADTQGSTYAGVTYEGIFRLEGTTIYALSVAVGPARFVLEPNFPNPFNSATHIRFGLEGA